MSKTRTRKPQAELRPDRTDDYHNYTLRNDRVDVGYTMSQLAELVGVSTSAISSYDRLRAIPEPLIAKRIAITLNERLHRTDNIENYVAQLFPEKLRKYVEEIRDEREGFPKDALTHSVPLNADAKKYLPYSPDNPVENTQYNDLIERMSKVMSTLSYREREILKSRMGLEGEHSSSYEEVGEIFGVTKERIKQIEAKAIRKLQQPSRSQELVGFLD